MDDRLLTIDEAAEILCLSKDWLYHHWQELPFAFKWSKKQLMFSLKGLQEYLEEKLNGRKSIQKG